MRAAGLLCRRAVIRRSVASGLCLAAGAGAPGATRHLSFRNPFSSAGGAANAATPNTSSTASAAPVADPVRRKHEEALSQAHQTASLLNERLVDACLDILELCGGSASGERPRLNLDHGSRETLWELADVLLHDFRRPPWEQFDLVYLSLCLPVALEDRHVHRSLMVILESIVPQPVYRVFEANNLIIAQDDEESLERRHVLRVFVHALLGDLHVQPGLEPEEVLLVYVDDFKTLFPLVASSASFVELEGDVEGIAMRAKLFSLLGQLCAEFDREGTGKVLLSDLQETAERVLGSEQAAMLLAGAPIDEHGKIAYPQLASLLTRPPPKKVASAAASGRGSS